MVAKINWTFMWQRGGPGTLMAASKTAAILLARTLRHQGQGCLVSTLTRDPYFIAYNSIKTLGHAGRHETSGVASQGSAARQAVSRS